MQPDPPPMAARAPAIILVEPQLGENIGAAARAMANFGLGDLRLVSPRDGWPSKKAKAAASGADGIIESVRVFASTAEAIADLNFVYATSARIRDLPKEVVGPREAVSELKRRAARRPGDRRDVRARALGADQRGDRARRCDRHLPGQSEIRLPQSRAGGAARLLRMDIGRARRRASGPLRYPGTRPCARVEGASARADGSIWKGRWSRPAIFARPTCGRPWCRTSAPFSSAPA